MIEGDFWENIARLWIKGSDRIDSPMIHAMITEKVKKAIEGRKTVASILEEAMAFDEDVDDE